MRQGFSATGDFAGLLFVSLALIWAKAPAQLLLAAACHEAGHILYAKIRRLGPPRAQLFFAGVRLRYPATVSYRDGFFLCLAGPAASLIAYFAAGGTFFSLYSLGLALINLLPVSCLDGGGMLYCLSCMIFPFERAVSVCRIVSSAAVTALVLFNILIQLKAGFNITLMAVTVYTAVTVLGESA